MIETTSSPAMSFVIDQLKADPTIEYRTVRERAAAKGLTIYPIVYGKAKSLLGLLPTRPGKENAEGQEPGSSGRTGTAARSQATGSPPAETVDRRSQVTQQLADRVTNRFAQCVPSVRSFSCHGCHKTIVCQHGDLRRRYCSPACARASRRSGVTAAGKRYQRTPQGREKRNARSRRYRKRRRQDRGMHELGDGSVDDFEGRLVRAMTDLQGRATADGQRLREAIRRAIEILESALEC